MICTKCAKVIHKKKGDYCITAKGPHHYECPPETGGIVETQDIFRQMSQKPASQVLYEQQQAEIDRLIVEVAQLKSGIWQAKDLEISRLKWQVDELKKQCEARRDLADCQGEIEKQLNAEIHHLRTNNRIMADAIMTVAEWDKKFVKSDYWENWQRAVTIAKVITDGPA